MYAAMPFLKFIYIIGTNVKCVEMEGVHLKF